MGENTKNGYTQQFTYVPPAEQEAAAVSVEIEVETSGGSQSPSRKKRQETVDGVSDFQVSDFQELARENTKNGYTQQFTYVPPADQETAAVAAATDARDTSPSRRRAVDSVDGIEDFQVSDFNYLADVNTRDGYTRQFK